MRSPSSKQTKLTDNKRKTKSPKHTACNQKPISKNIKSSIALVNPRPRPLALRDLECIATLGQGSFGKVILTRVRDRESPHSLDVPGALFATKVFVKEEFRDFDKRHPDATHSERGRLSELPWSPWINGLISTFSDTTNLYLTLSLCPSGTLLSLISSRAPFSASVTRFYFANIVCGLHFLHEHGVVHRDLKPGNILLGADGYLCLADFGYAKEEDDQEDGKNEGGIEGKVPVGGGWAMIGTPIYMAPEIVEWQPVVGRSVDWWASGVILFEMATRKLPFYGKTEPATFKRTLSGRYAWPRHLRIGPSLRSLVAGLLTHDASKRLGTYGAGDVMGHAWMTGVDWDRMGMREYIAPYTPPNPALDQMWLDKPLPEPHTMPGLHVVAPPVHRQHDMRLPKKRRGYEM